MKKIILDENEVVRILNMHKLLKEQDSPAPTTPPITLAAPATPKPEVPVDPRKILIDARDNGCLTNGQIGKNHPRTKGFYFRGKKQSTGQEVDFFPDMTYEFVDGSKKGKWNCNKVNAQNTNTKATEQQKQDYIKYYTDRGYKQTLSAAEMASDEYQKFKVSGSEQLFGPNGLELYGKKSVSKEDSETLLQDVKDIKGSQTIDKSKCKEMLKLYYQAYETKREFPQQTFDNFKKSVQSCVNYYDKEGWGGIPIRLNKYVKILRSQVEGGPSLRGSDSKWRLN
jgi:hypothetical protein